jgi:uncharacterized iron-regulated membrane protein
MSFMRKLHKWLGLLIGLQVLLWAASGVMFAWLDPAAVAAEGSVRTAESSVFSSSIARSEPAAWMRDYAHEELYDVRVMSLADRWVWRVEMQDRVEMRAIEDGSRVQLDATWVRQLALGRYSGSGPLTGVTLQTSPDIESRASSPVWRAAFDDAQHTNLYFAADDGRLIAARSDSWRVRDFFWMLHTMDYAGRDDFNNPLIIAFGTASLWLAVSGIVLLLRSFGVR